MTKKTKKIKPLTATCVMPSEEGLLAQLYGILATEVARLQQKQTRSATDMKLAGAKQIEQLIKSARSISDEQRTRRREDSIQQLTDQQRIELLGDLISQLPADQKQLLFQGLLEDKKDDE